MDTKAQVLQQCRRQLRIPLRKLFSTKIPEELRSWLNDTKAAYMEMLARISSRFEAKGCSGGVLTVN